MDRRYSPLLYCFNGLARYLETRAAVGGIVCWRTVPLTASEQREWEAEFFARQAAVSVGQAVADVRPPATTDTIDELFKNAHPVDFAATVSPFALDGEGRSWTSVNRLVGYLSETGEEITDSDSTRRVHFLLPADGRLIQGNCPLNEHPNAVPGKNENSLAFATLVDESGQMTGQQRTTLQSCRIQLEDMLQQPVTITGTPEFERAMQNQATPAMANGIGPSHGGALPQGTGSFFLT